MNEKKITKFAFGAGLLFLFFRFFYRLPDESARATVQAVQAVLAALTVVSDGAPALIFFFRKKRFGTADKIFAGLFALQAAMLAWYFSGGFPDAPAVVILAEAAALIVWQSMILNPPKKNGGKP